MILLPCNNTTLEWYIKSKRSISLYILIYFCNVKGGIIPIIVNLFGTGTPFLGTTICLDPLPPRPKLEVILLKHLFCLSFLEISAAN